MREDEKEAEDARRQDWQFHYALSQVPAIAYQMAMGEPLRPEVMPEPDEGIWAESNTWWHSAPPPPPPGLFGAMQRTLREETG